MQEEKNCALIKNENAFSESQQIYLRISKTDTKDKVHIFGGVFHSDASGFSHLLKNWYNGQAYAAFFYFQ